MTKTLKLRIHGDNIVECERCMAFLVEAILGDNATISHPMGQILTPTFEAKNKNIILNVQYFPGYGRWEPDILEYIKSRGATLREAADSVICFFLEGSKDYEKPILAIEFCGALAAGNQAWQRCGRAISFAAAGIPYLYITELGGMELDSLRKEKAIRLPNPIVPFSYLLLSEFFNTIALPVFLASPVTSQEALKKYYHCFGNIELLRIIKAMILGGDTKEIFNALSKKVLILTDILSSSRRNEDTLKPPQWKEWFEKVRRGGASSEFIEKNPLPWSKTAYISGLTKTAKEFMKMSERYAIGPGSSNIPICLIPKKKRVQFSRDVQKIYPNLHEKFVEWLKDSKPLGVCWIMGFKPHGDDARPDRGLPPLARMILGPEIDILTIVYGPAKKSTWPMLRTNPTGLADQNGLWESILAMSDGLIIDSATCRDSGEKTFLKSHWAQTKISSTDEKILATKTFPVIVGENDVDTVIHTIFTGTKSTNRIIFEGACNPPGGDWSGISLLSADMEEGRWVSLPRVSGEHTKRPDHIFQLFLKSVPPIILAIESKKTAGLIECNIGKRLIQYLKELIVSPPSVIRTNKSCKWITSHKSVFHAKDFIFASCAAFLDERSFNAKEFFKRSKVDLLIGVTASAGHSTIRVLSNSRIGDAIKRNLDEIIVELSKYLSVDVLK